MSISPLGVGLGEQIEKHNRSVLQAIQQVCPKEKQPAIDFAGVGTNGEFKEKYFISIKWSPRWGIGFTVIVFEDGLVNYATFGLSDSSFSSSGETSLNRFNELLQWIGAVVNYVEKKKTKTLGK